MTTADLADATEATLGAIRDVITNHPQTREALWPVIGQVRDIYNAAYPHVLNDAQR